MNGRQRMTARAAPGQERLGESLGTFRDGVIRRAESRLASVALASCAVAVLGVSARALVGLLPERFDVAEWTRRSREAQGLPPKITDRLVLGKIARLIPMPSGLPV
jgi:hypothetical protein